MTQICLQLYTLRDFLKTPADIAATLKRVRAIGYDAVQVSGMGPIPAKDLRNMLDGEGLICAATHTGIDRIKAAAQEVIDENLALGSKLTAIGGFFKQTSALADWEAFVSEFGPLCETFERGGVRMGYHNHSHEFIRTDPPEPVVPMQYLLQKLPKSAWIEFDTYWVQHGGGDPAAWIEKVSGRIPVVHLKDMAVARVDGKVTAQMAEVGEGNLNWPAILQACKRAGVQWYSIEQDVCQRDPFESVAISLRNVRAMGLK